MTKAKLEARLRHWQKYLRLDHWEIEIDYEGLVEEDTDAHVEINDQIDEAAISLCPVWRNWSDLRTDVNLVHELIHVMMRDVDDLVEERLDGTLSDETYRLFRRQYVVATEQFVNRLSRALTGVP